MYEKQGAELTGQLPDFAGNDAEPVTKRENVLVNRAPRGAVGSSEVSGLWVPSVNAVKCNSGGKRSYGTSSVGVLELQLSPPCADLEQHSLSRHNSISSKWPEDRGPRAALRAGNSIPIFSGKQRPQHK